MSKPTIVVVPGAWHVPAHFSKVTASLEAAGYTCIGVNLPGNSDSPYTSDKSRLIGIQDDQTAIRQTVQAQLSAGHDVVLITHSYGCIPGPAALAGLNDSNNNTNGHVKAVVMIAGFLCPPGTTMLALMGGQLLPQYLYENNATLPFNGPGAIHVLYNDVEINEALKAVWRLKPQSYGINTSVIPDQLAGLKGIPLSFLLCRKDNATPWEMQTASIKGFKDAGVEVYAEVADSGHSPFLNFVEQTTRFVTRAAGEEVETGFEAY